MQSELLAEFSRGPFKAFQAFRSADKEAAGDRSNFFARPSGCFAEIGPIPFFTVGVHWDATSDTRIAHLHSDCPNTVSYDPKTKQYVMYCRAKHIYRAFGDEMIDTGASRRIARLASDSLWTDWLAHAEPQTILTPERHGAVGLAKIRKEGFISLRGPRRGGVVCTRQLRWPGGELLVNADATEGLLHVRVSDKHRKPIAGFDHVDCQPFRGDEVSHRVSWNDRSLGELTDQIIRLEFYLQEADLYSFRAGASSR